MPLYTLYENRRAKSSVLVFFLFLIFAAGVVNAAEKTLTILYTGDSYGVLGYVGWPGGLARRKTAIERVRLEDPAALLLDSGNSFGPFFFSRYDKARLTCDSMAEMNYDVLNLGPHEFDYGQERLLELKNNSKIHFLSSNIYGDPGGDPWAEEFLIKEINGIRIGIIGLCDTEISQKTVIGGFDGLKAADPEATLRKLAPRLRSATDLLVVISNLEAGKMLKLAARFSEIDIVISRSTGGETEYDHKPFPTAYDFSYFVKKSSDTKTPEHTTVFAYASRFGFDVGKIDVAFSGDNAPRFKTSVVPMPESVPEDPRLKIIVDERIREIEQAYSTVLIDDLSGALQRPFEKEDFLYLILQIMRNEAGTEIAAINETAFYKLEYMSGSISRKNKLAALELQQLTWTDNHLVTQKMAGSQLKDLLAENNAYPRLRFLGLNRDNSGNITVNGRPVKDEELYSVATSNYLAFGPHPWPVLTRGAAVKDKFNGARIILRDLSARTLAADRAKLSPEQWRRKYRRENAVPYPAQWNLAVENAQLNLSKIQMHNSGKFSNISDARVTAADQFTIGAALRAWALRDTSAVTWKTQADAAYTRVSLKNSFTNDSVDSLVFGSQINCKNLRIPIGFRQYMLPSLRVSYDTEFTPASGNPAREILRSEYGFYTTLNSRLDELRLSVMSEYNLNYKDTHYGLSLYLKRHKSLVNRYTLYQEAYGTYLPPAADKKSADFSWQLDIKNRLDIPVRNNVSLGVYVNVFGWEGQLVRETGWNLSTGISLSFSQLWKL